MPGCPQPWGGFTRLLLGACVLGLVQPERKALPSLLKHPGNQGGVSLRVGGAGPWCSPWRLSEGRLGGSGWAPGQQWGGGVGRAAWGARVPVKTGAEGSRVEGGARPCVAGEGCYLMALVLGTRL